MKERKTEVVRVLMTPTEKRSLQALSDKRDASMSMIAHEAIMAWIAAVKS